MLAGVAQDKVINSEYDRMSWLSSSFFGEVQLR